MTKQVRTGKHRDRYVEQPLRRCAGGSKEAWKIDIRISRGGIEHEAKSTEYRIYSRDLFTISYTPCTGTLASKSNSYAGLVEDPRCAMHESHGRM
jgi:hypothetical protein